MPGSIAYGQSEPGYLSALQRRTGSGLAVNGSEACRLNDIGGGAARLPSQSVIVTSLWLPTPNPLVFSRHASLTLSAGAKGQRIAPW